MTQLEDAIETLRHLIAFPTITTDSNLEICAFLADRLEASGASVTLLPDATGQKANIWATLGPEAHGGLVLSGHTDVVPADRTEWATDPFLLHQEGDRLYGRGTCDMKGFLACCIAALPVLRRSSDSTPIHFAFTYDEEIGCFGAQALVDHLRGRSIRPAMALIGEPTEMRLVDGHKGCCEYRVTFRGAEGHGSAPHLGVNAIEYASLYVSKLLRHREKLAANPPIGSPFDPPETTVNIGQFHAGTATNVIPGRAQLDWEMRPVNWCDAETLTEELQRYCIEDLLPRMQAANSECAIEMETVSEVPGLEPRTANTARDLVASILGRNSTECVAFGTEAGLFQQLGLDAIVCGPGSISQAHKPNEYVEIAQLEQTLALLNGIAEGI